TPSGCPPPPGARICATARFSPLSGAFSPGTARRKPGGRGPRSDFRDRLLAVEVVSPDSRERDRVEKFCEYERGGVREYWLIDPEEKRADFYQLGEDGKCRLAPAGPDGIYRSAVLPGLWIRTDWLWQEPLPPVMGILKEWGLV
ncbi:MAG: Uma2 family endonuclease, partial [Planctomycetes bacterium]|nr:Uma2 family endonuclease [Planctomycetota bacterium]